MQNKNNYMTVKGMSLSHVIAVLIDIRKPISQSRIIFLANKRKSEQFLMWR